MLNALAAMNADERVYLQGCDQNINLMLAKPVFALAAKWLEGNNDTEKKAKNFVTVTGRFAGIDMEIIVRRAVSKPVATVLKELRAQIAALKGKKK